MNSNKFRDQILSRRQKRKHQIAMQKHKGKIKLMRSLVTKMHDILSDLDLSPWSYTPAGIRVVADEWIEDNIKAPPH